MQRVATIAIRSDLLFPPICPPPPPSSLHLPPFIFSHTHAHLYGIVKPAWKYNIAGPTLKQVIAKSAKCSETRSRFTPLCESKVVVVGSNWKSRQTQDLYSAAIELLSGKTTKMGGAQWSDPNKVVPLDVAGQRDIVHTRGTWNWVEAKFAFSIVCGVVQRSRDMISCHCRNFCDWGRCIHTTALRIKKGLPLPESWV